MIQQLKNILQNVDNYAILSESKLLVIIKSYRPYCDCTLDSYYLASNTLYQVAKQIVDILGKFGFARIANDISFRKVVFETGIADIKGINSMAISSVYGSYFCINVIKTDVDVSKLGNVTTAVKSPKKCADCKKCVYNCPNGAIGIDGSFDASKCIRSYMQGQAISRQMFDTIGDRFLGCDDCQGICPHNQHIQRVNVDQNIKNLVSNALYDYKSFAKIIGSNYARGKIIVNNAIIVAGNTKDISHLQRLRQLQQNPIYSGNAQIAISKIIDAKI